jgi:hypothetical protein
MPPATPSSMPPPPPPGSPWAQPPGWSPGAGQPLPPPGWPDQGRPGDWSAPGYGSWSPSGPRNNGMGVAALVLGIVGLVLSWTVIGGVVLGILALVFGLIGRGRVRRREADNGGQAVAGVTLGSIAIVLGIVFLFVYLAQLQEDQRQYEACVDEGNPQSYCETVYDPPFGT